MPKSEFRMISPLNTSFFRVTPAGYLCPEIKKKYRSVDYSITDGVIMKTAVATVVANGVGGERFDLKNLSYLS